VPAKGWHSVARRPEGRGTPPSTSRTSEMATYFRGAVLGVVTLSVAAIVAEEKLRRTEIGEKSSASSCPTSDRSWS